MRMLIFVYVLLSSATAQQPGLKFKEGFQEFLNTNKYNGAQVGVMIANRLAYAKTYGKGHDDTNLELLAKHQISAISKAFTSIAILKLHDEGKLTLDSKVFGTDGILPEVKPWKEENIDKRIYDITVENLLYHTAGWDYVHSSMADPMLNSAMLKRGETTKNISNEMKLVTEETSRDIIRYMLSERLDYTPGTKSVISNLGYVILGRIIEEVSDFPYEDYVKTNILFPCGMMHTRIGKIHRCVKHDNDPAFKCEVTSRLVDAALGWESNVYDLARLSQCMDGSADFSIISDKMAKLLLHKPKAVPVQHSDTWIGPGFHVNNKGAIWIESERYTNDLLFYHTGPFHGKLKSILEKHKPTALIVLLEGQNYAPIKYLVRKMVNDETNWPLENLLLDDVADVTLKVGNTDRIIKYEINEHHIKPYTHAIGQLRYDIKWIHGHLFSGSSIFTVIAEKTNIPIYDKVIVESGLSEKDCRHKNSTLKNLIII